MIINENKFNEVIGLDEDMTVKMVVDESNIKKLLMILSQSLYSDPVGSLVREYCTNALDSHVENNIKEPIKVSLKREQGHFVFSVEDFGVGLSPSRVEHVFSKYLSSTKEGKKDEIGYWGLGSKSGLSYCDNFTIISRYEGIEYHYLMFKSEEGTSLSLLDMFNTSMGNGVQIKISLKLDNDYGLFIDKIKSQLCYFEDVFIEDYYNEIKKDYKIIKTDLWKYSELNEDDYLHISLNNIYYKLDFSKLGIEPIKMPVALSFSLSDNITPTPSRESFMYTPAVKELILNRIRDVGNYFVNKWNSMIPQVETLEEANRLKKDLYEIPIYSEKTLTGEKEIKVKIDKKICKYCDQKLKSVVLSLWPNLNLERLDKISAYLLQEYEVKSKFDYGKYTSKLGYRDDQINQYNNKILFLDKGEALSSLQIQFLRYEYETDCIKIVRKHSILKLGKLKSSNQSTDNYYGLLELNKHPKNEWRTIIKEYQSLIKSYTDKWVRLANVIPTEEFLTWKKEHKEKIKRVKLGVEEIKVFIGRKPMNGRAKKDVIYESATFKIKDLDILGKGKGAEPNKYIYADDSREDELNKFINFIDYDVVLCNPKTYKNIKKLNLNNWVNIDDILTKRNRLFSKIVTQYILDQVLALRNDNLYDTEIFLIHEVNSNISSKIIKLKNYENRGFPYKFRVNLYKYYIENKWFDYNMWGDIIFLYNAIPSLEFTKDVKYLHKENSYYSKFIKLVWNDYKDKKQDKPFDEFLKELVTNLK